MTRYQKRRRRRRILGMLFTALLLAVAAIMGASRLHARRLRIQFRTTGLAALAQGDYQVATTDLGHYVATNPSDIEAMYAYATAVRGMGFAEPGNFAQAIAALRRVCDAQPSNLTAAHDLLDLYTMGGFNSEATELAGRLLQANANDSNALWNRAVAAVRLRHFKEALADSRNLNAAAPGNLDGQLLTIDLLHLTDAPADQIIRHAETSNRQVSDNASYELLCGFAHQVTGDRSRALDLFHIAAQHAGGNADLVPRIVRLLDNAGAYAQSIATLQTSVQLNPESLPLLRQLARRLDQSGRPDLVLALLDSAPSSSRNDVELQISRGIALLHLQKLNDLDGVTQQLATHPDTAARAWTAVFKSLLQTPSTLEQNLAILQEQVPRHGTDPMLRLMLGNALAASGKSDEAIAMLEQASQLAPTWGAPHARRAELLTARGQAQPALDAARLAFDREPQSAADAALVVNCWSATLPRTGDAPTKLLELAENIHRTAPQETRILPALAALYLRNKNLAGAQNMVDAAITCDPAPSADVFINLAKLSEANHLERRDQLLTRCRDKYGASAPLALARAIDLSAQNQKPQALQALTPPADLTPAQRRDWDFARVHFLETTADPTALAAWQKLTRDYPHDPAILRAVLNSQGAWQDLALVAEALDHLKSIAGPADIDYRVGRARMLLADAANPGGSQEAVALLNESVQAAPQRVDIRLLLARALRGVSNFAGASQQIAQAVLIDPQSPAASLAQAQLLVDEGDSDSARLSLDRFEKLNGRSTAQLHRGAALLAQLRLPDRAIACLLQAYPGNPVPPDAMLIALYSENKQPDKAQAVVTAMLAHPDAPAIEACADFYGSTGRLAEAEKLLARLDEFAIEPGLKELSRAQFAGRYQSYDDAQRHLQLATTEAPQSSRVWKAVIAHDLVGGRTDDALAAATRASQQLKYDSAVQFFLDRSSLIRELGADALARPLLVSMIREPENRQAAADGLTFLHGLAQGQSRVALAASIQSLADRQPQFLALRVLSVQLLLQIGRTDDAVTAASQAMQKFPDRAEPAALAAQALAAAGRWQESTAVARQWRSRPDAAPVDADVVIADSELRLGDAASALSTVQPYLAAARADTGRFAPVIIENARALLASNRIQEASALLTPEMAKLPQWRMIWIRLAVESIHEAGAASDWLKHISTQIPSEAGGERIELARAWFLLAQQYKLDAFRDQSESILQAVTKDPKASAIAFTSLAIVRNAKGDPAGAEQAYRKAAACNPPDPVAQNNLAMILNHQHHEAAEAVTLATAAVGARPQSATFLDTLAQAQLQNNKPHEAIDSWNKALVLDPSNPGWHLRLAEAYVATHDLPHARQTFEKAQSLATDSPTLPADFQDRLNHLRQQIVYAR